MTNKTFAKPTNPAVSYDYTRPQVADCFRHNLGSVYIVYRFMDSNGNYRYGLLDIADGWCYGTPVSRLSEEIFMGNKDCFTPLSKIEVTPTLL
jgi:hypothetical protein